ncbi:transaldolase [Actinacidiphila sp. bgisy167]|uniref:transaldolase n=1 Tax=Actinacidiphila sp. bgisy167 TaxID=3413797 RepID=UPI003D72314D
MITVNEVTTATTAEPLQRLAAQGVSVWLDDLSRRRLDSGDLARLVVSGRVVGVTTNPSIFRAAIGSGEDYREQLAELAGRGVTADEAVRTMTAADVRAAADILRPVYETTGGRDGRVSIEVDPRLAHRTEATVAEAVRLARLVDRPNVMVKIPATVAGLPAITEVTGLGISVNVTLIFSLDRYREVMEAYAAGLEKARAAGVDLSTVHSVASFFVSRVDTEVDRRLTELGTDEASALKGRAALANARLAYQAQREFFGGDRWAGLAAAGAHRQRPLWASTGVKDPAYRDTRYVEELVAPGTVTTLPEATLDAVADHGRVGGDTVTGRHDGARADLNALERLGIRYDEVVRQLEDEGVAKFEAAWDELLQAVETVLNGKGADAR